MIAPEAMSTPSFGRYTLLNKLAVGGMAEIFLARVSGEAGFTRTCVVKRVLAHLAADPAFVKLFLNEAQVAARLHHPGIVQIFDLGKEGDAYFIAMEYLPGESLAALLEECGKRRRELPVAVALEIAAQAAEALHHAHTVKNERGAPMGVVHCDVSPTNVLVTYQGAVKIVDFGVARFAEHVRRTTGTALNGTVGYMAPEQIGDRPVSARTDVWSLGVVLYELLTGTRLFDAGNTVAILQRVIAAPIAPPTALKRSLPRQVDAVLLKALERDPAGRYESAAAFASALRDALALPQVAATRVALGDFLREVFGAERAERVVAQLSAPTGRADVPSTAALEPEAVQAIVPPPRLPRRGLWAGAGLVAALGLAAVALAVGRGPPVAPVRERAKLDFRAEVASVPPGAEVRVDGALRAERTPAALEGLTAGRHEVVLVREGFSAASTWIELGPERPVAQLVVQLSLKERPTEALPPPVAAPVSPRAAHEPTGRPHSLLSVESNVEAEVWLDDAKLGAVPLKHARVPTGRHRLKVSNRELGVARTLTVELKPNDELQRRVDFGKGKLSVSATQWADVLLDGKKLGQTPLAAREVWEGAHTLQLVGPDREKTVSIVVQPGQTTTVNEHFP
jgi:serine/threonine-protein kinase